MAGTETNEEKRGDQDSGTSAADGGRSDAHWHRGQLDESVISLTVSGLRSRLHCTKTWKAQGNVAGEPLLLVRQACLQFLEETKADAAELGGLTTVVDDGSGVVEAVDDEPDTGKHRVCPDCHFAGGNHFPGCPRD